MRSSNPILSDRTFGPSAWQEMVAAQEKAGKVKAAANVMTLQGTAYKAGFLIALCVIAAGISWYTMNQGMVQPIVLGLGGAIIGLLTGFVVMVSPKSAPIVGPIYAIAEGAFLGAISILIASRLERKMPGLGATTVAQAVGITFAIFVAMLAGYATGILRLGSTAKKIVIAGTLGVGLCYLVSMVMNLAFGTGIPLIHSSGPIGIGFSLVVIVLAAFNLSIDFDFIDAASRDGNQPKYMEWVGAVGLLATLVWLYVEVLRLLNKLRR